MKKYLYFVCVFVFVSCSLDTDNEKMAPAYTRLESLNDLQAVAANLYLQPWYEFHNRMLQLGDARANNMVYAGIEYNEWNAAGTFNEDMNPSLMQRPWASLYNVIAQADYLLDDYVPYCIEHQICAEADAQAVAGEARLIRAVAYWYLSVYWHNVPIVDNPTTISSQARANRYEDVMRYAIRDAEFAADRLPESPYQQGRVTKTSARVLLSRLYLTMGAYTRGGHVLAPREGETAAYWFHCADSIATLAITEADAAGYTLMKDYEEIFRVQNNNGPEVLFALQCVAHATGGGLTNPLSYNMCYSYCLDNHYGKTWGTNSSYDFLRVAALRGGMSRTRGNVFLPGTTYTYLFHEMENDADPKQIDCTAGSHHKGDIWVVDPQRGMVPVKKYVVGGPLATGGVATVGNSGFCTPLLRLSEAYLNQSEARLMLTGETESSDAAVLEGINTIRQRAFRMEKEAGTYGPGLRWHDYESINTDSLLQERRMEFYGEGLFWGDIVRYSFYSDEHLQWTLRYMNNKQINYTDDPTVGCYRQYKYGYRRPENVDAEVGGVVLATSGTICYRPSKECTRENLWAMPYPPTELSLDPALAEEPVAYQFSK